MNQCFTSNNPSITLTVMSTYTPPLANKGVSMVSKAVTHIPPPYKYFPPILLARKPVGKKKQIKTKIMCFLIKPIKAFFFNNAVNYLRY